MILWRHTLGELVKLILVTTLVLVTVIAFAASIKPLAEGKLGPVDTLRFMALAIPPMLQYALPFAAGFGATLAFHRIAQENEIIARYAGGVSHASVLAPALACGVLLSGSLALLNEQIIPRFLRNMEELITEDLTKILVASMGSGEALEYQGKLFRADDVRRLGPDPEGNLRDHLLLTGVVVLQFDEEGHRDFEATAERARIFVYPPDEHGHSLAYVHLENPVIFDSKSRQVSEVESESMKLVWEVPNAFTDDPKFLTSGELARAHDHPEMMNWIDSRRVDLAHHIAERRVTASMHTGLVEGDITLVHRETGQVLRVEAGAIHWDHGEQGWKVTPDPGTDTVQIVSTLDGVTSEYVAQHAFIRTNMGTEQRRRVSVELELINVEGRVEGSPGGERRLVNFRGYRLDPDPAVPLLAKSSAELLDLADAMVEGPTPDEFVANPRRELKINIERLRREILSKRHERWAMAASCLVMVLTGAITAIRLATGQALTVYLWSFFPALATVITISSGQQLTHQSGATGLFVLWGGVAFLGAYAFLAYLGLRKH